LPPIIPGCIDSTSSVPPDPPQINAWVIAAKGNDLYDMFGDLLTELGRIEMIVQQSDTVFIKPDMVTLPWAFAELIISVPSSSSVKVTRGVVAEVTTWF